MHLLRDKPGSRHATQQGGGSDAGAPHSVAAPALSELALARLVSEKALSNFPEIARSRAVAMLLVLRPEVTHVAALTAMCASAANALATRPDLRAARALTKFFPVESATFILASTRFRRLGQSPGVCDALCEFNEALSGAMTASMEYTAARQMMTDLTAIPTGDLTQSWQSACHAALALLAAIDSQISLFNPLSRADDGDMLVSVLKVAAKGGSPLRSPGGGYEMPAWVEQRRSPRLTVACHATLMVGSQISTVEITDVSTGGVGIEMTGRLEPGDNVVIKVGHIILAGTVVWRRPPRAGIAFAQSLIDDSPTYKFLSGRTDMK